MNTVTFSKLAELLNNADLLTEVHNAPVQELALTGADSDSRFVQPNHLFVCKGAAFKPAYLSSALKKGAVAYLCDEEHAQELDEIAQQVPALVVRDVRPAMALAALKTWGHPDAHLHTVGITGTKGKTTTSYLLRAILDAQAGTTSTAMIGSVETFDGIEQAESINTTPEACDLWRHVANAHMSGLHHLVMEVSSQALKYDRVVGLQLDVAAFLNIGRDHISPLEHPTWDDYFASKLRIFNQAKTAVVNLETEHLSEVLSAAKACEHIITFSAQGQHRHGHTADVWAEQVVSGFGKSSFVLHTPTWTAPVTLSMAGTFNVDNALAAVAIATTSNIDATSVQTAFARASVPGRMELVPSKNGQVMGIVDFAHNGMAFAKFGPSVRHEFPGWSVIAVFGATGDKAVERRFELPKEAAKWADQLIFTKDDPGHEDVTAICNDMASVTPANVPYKIIPNRAAAVQHAVDLAFASGNKTVVCVLARGTESVEHENGQLIPDALDKDLVTLAIQHHEG